MRVAYSLCGITPGREFEELKDLTQLLPMGFGDRLLRFNGIGERITWAMNNNNQPGESEREKYYEIARWAAERGMSLTMHWPRDDSVGLLLDIFERVNKEIPIANLRWSIAHLNDASPEVCGACTRWASAGPCSLDEAFRPWTPPRSSAWWWARAPMLIAWPPTIHSPHSNNLWMARCHARRRCASTPWAARGFRTMTMNAASIEPGKLADLAVLSKDYMTVPAEQVGGIESLLTMLGGKIVYAAGPYAQFEEKH